MNYFSATYSLQQPYLYVFLTWYGYFVKNKCAIGCVGKPGRNKIGWRLERKQEQRNAGSSRKLSLRMERLQIKSRQGMIKQWRNGNKREMNRKKSRMKMMMTSQILKRWRKISKKRLPRFMLETQRLWIVSKKLCKQSKSQLLSLRLARSLPSTSTLSFLINFKLTSNTEET